MPRGHQDAHRRPTESERRRARSVAQHLDQPRPYGSGKSCLRTNCPRTSPSPSATVPSSLTFGNSALVARPFRRDNS
eukprot:2558175-Alexandrium_andersonii.AAC.1